MIKIHHISDTHQTHDKLNLPDGVDLIIHSGDATNYKDVKDNTTEMMYFLNWYEKVSASTKIYVAGNHDVSLEKRIYKRHHFEDRGIIYLENEHYVYNGIKIFGSPISPSFGVGWAFNRNRSKIHKTWDLIDEDVDIIVTHGPPYSMLDSSPRINNTIEHCGCKNLLKQIQFRLKNTKLACFGHIHGNSDFDNHGILYRDGIYYSNGSVVKDGKIGEIYSNGNTFLVDENKRMVIC